MTLSIHSSIHVSHFWGFCTRLDKSRKGLTSYLVDTFIMGLCGPDKFRSHSCGWMANISHIFAGKLHLQVNCQYLIKLKSNSLRDLFDLTGLTWTDELFGYHYAKSHLWSDLTMICIHWCLVVMIYGDIWLNHLNFVSWVCCLLPSLYCHHGALNLKSEHKNLVLSLSNSISTIVDCIDVYWSHLIWFHWQIPSQN